MKKLLLLLTFISLAYVGVGQTTYTQDFEGSWGTSGYGTYTVQGSQNQDWEVNEGLRESSNVNNGSYACRLNDGGSQYLTSPEITGIGNVTFHYRHWDGSPALEFKVQKSTDGNSWTDIETFSSFTNTTYQEFNQDVNDANAKYIRIESNGNERLIIDDFSITDY